jgi:hypothetical protein
MNNTFARRSLAPALAAAAAISASFTALSTTVLAEDSHSQALSSALATPEQLKAEHLLTRLLKEPAIQAAANQAREKLQQDPAATTPEGRARLANAVAEWTTSLILREIAADTQHPTILWTVDNTPHQWFGNLAPGSAVAGDNPDHIYRTAFLDGTSRYEVVGKLPPDKPVQFSFELTQGGPGTFPLQGQSRSHADMGGQLGMITNRELTVAADGTFRITIDSDPASGNPNHLRSQPGSLSLVIRDVLSDWQQRPNALEIRLLGSPDRARPREDEILKRTLADLPGYVEFWGSFKNTWFGGNLPVNVVNPPVARDGGWGYLSAGRYDLADDEVLLVTTRPQDAGYTGAQVTDAWMVAKDARQYQTSVNTAQSIANGDKTVTYAIGPRDPHLANWLDTGGLHQGFVLFRWQAFPDGGRREGLLSSYRVVKLRDLAKPEFASLPRVNDQQRRQQLTLRSQQYTNRLTAAR